MSHSSLANSSWKYFSITNPHFIVATREIVFYLVHGQSSDFGRPIQISVRFRQFGSIQDSI